MVTGRIPFDRVRDASLAHAERLLFQWFPAGKITGREFEIGNLQGDEGDSLKVNLNTGKWSDFAGDTGGFDLIELRAQMEHNGNRVSAARELADMLGISAGGPRPPNPKPPPGKTNWQPMVPPPPNAGEPLPNQLKGFDIVYKYTDADGKVLFYIRRKNASGDQDKVILPLTYGNLNGKVAWHAKHSAAPRPLYGLDRLEKMVGLSDPWPAKVILCEGEKAADAAQAMFPDHACVTWVGGAKAIKQADFAPLQKRDVILWPDNDEPGRKATVELRRILPNMRVLRVDDLNDGDDAADVHPENPDAWLADHILSNEPAPESSEWPRGFSFSAKGMWFKPQPTEQNPKPNSVWVCAPFTVIAETADEIGNSWGMLLRWRDANKLDHQWAMPRRLLHADGNQIAMELEGAGLKVGVGKRAHELLKDLLGGIVRSERRRCVTRCGWHGNVYLLPTGETFGKNGTDIVFQTSHVPAADAIRPRGTLDEWREHVAKFAVGNYRLALSISTSLVGPLLDIIGDPSGGLHFQGGSQIGKTTLLGCGASVYGRSTPGGPIKTWKATSNGLEGSAAETCDGNLHLDELGMAEAREVGGIVYSLSSETGKTRATRDGSASQAPSQIWRVMFTSTGEVSLATKLLECGITPMAGQEVRFINIPADAGMGLGVYQNLHGKDTGAALSDHLRETTRTYYGTAIRAFLTRLADGRSEDAAALVARIKRVRDAFMLANTPVSADGQVISVAKRFALIAAAGELAREYGVLPWPNGESVRAAAACFQAWLDARGGSGAAEDLKAIATVRAFIERHGESRFTDLSQPSASSSEGGNGKFNQRDTVNRAGYRRKNRGEWEFLILPEQWRTEVCKGLSDHVRAAAALHAAGHLIPGEIENRKGKQIQRWDRKQTVPDVSGQIRVYTISDSILEGDVRPAQHTMTMPEPPKLSPATKA